MIYDYWIRSGRVIDPARNIDCVEDLFIYNSKIMPKPEGWIDADEIIDATDCLVLPGLIDFHTHLAQGMTDVGLNPDLMTLPNGVTSAVDAGSTGWANFPGFLKRLVLNSDITIKAYLNISSNGVMAEPYSENTDPERINEKEITRIFELYAEHLLGLKVRVGKFVSHENGLRPLAATVELGKVLNVPVVAHVVHPEESYSEIFKLLRAGDILCHCFQEKGLYTILGTDGKIQQLAKEARERGVLFDHAAGRANYGFGVAQAAVRDGFYPDIISTDVVPYSIYKRKVFALPYTLSAYLAMGMPLVEIVRACTQTPARLMKLANIGSLAPGMLADIAIFHMQNYFINFKDQFGHIIPGKHLLIPQLTLKAGKIAYRHITFMDW
jgi:dihydroorotase